MNRPINPITKKPIPDLVDLAKTNNFAFYWQFVKEKDFEFFAHINKLIHLCNPLSVFNEAMGNLYSHLTPRGERDYRADFLKYLKQIAPTRYQYARFIFWECKKARKPKPLNLEEK